MYTESINEIITVSNHTVNQRKKYTRVCLQRNKAQSNRKWHTNKTKKQYWEKNHSIRDEQSAKNRGHSLVIYFLFGFPFRFFFLLQARLFFVTPQET